MLEVFSQTFTAIGGPSLILVGLAAWLGKLWLSRQLSRERQALQLQLDATNARLSASLEHTVHVERVQFEHEFTIYKEVWSRLVELRMVTMRLRPVLDQAPAGESHEETMRKRITDFAIPYESFRDVVEKNKPFYAAAVYARLEAVLEKCYSEQVDYQYTERHSDGYWKEAQESRRQITAAIDEACEAIRSRIAEVKVSQS